MRFADFTESENRVLVLALSNMIQKSKNELCVKIAEELIAEAYAIEDYIIQYEKNWSGK